MQNSSGGFFVRPVVHNLGNEYTPRIRVDVLGGTLKLLTSIKTKHRNSLNLEPVLILALTKIHPRIEVLGYQKQAQSESH
jgi:hypothetical protein